MSQRPDLTTPEWFPLGYRADTDSILFFPLSRRDYAAASFLDGRLLKADSRGLALPVNEVRAAVATMPERCHFIFHISHVGSTLLSRLLGDHPALFSLREPLVFRALAELHRRGDPHLSDLASIFLRLWSRTERPEQSALIKCTSFVSEMAEWLLERIPTARAIQMYVPPRRFLEGLLEGAMSDITENAAQRAERLHRRCGVSAPTLSPGEQVAQAWLCEMTALTAAARRFPDRVLWLDFEQFLKSPESGVRTALLHLDVTSTDATIQAIFAKPTMTTYAKKPEVIYDASVRQKLLEQTARNQGSEIERGLAWLQRWGVNCGEMPGFTPADLATIQH